MANYLARVELHNAKYEDYETLHEAMRKRGFGRIIVANDGKKYQLPTGTYVVEKTNATLEQAYSAAQAAATETGKSFWVIVVDWTAARFSLPQV
jgi:protein-disulfide isomerase-like protein with CxxC motif